MRFWVASLVFLTFGAAAERLPALAADTTKITVSGVSSGGYMAVQMHVAYSDRVSGAGALAAGPYYCAAGSLWTAWNTCMSGSPPASKADAERFAREGRIDPLANLAGAPVWLFSGTRDRTVIPAVVQALAKQYALFGAKLALVQDRAAGHAMVTEHAGAACDATEPPFINDCDYDAAGEILRHLLGSLSPPSGGGQIIEFEQDEFGAGRAISMAKIGFAYVPQNCATGKCRVHVAFHGCRQGGEEIGDRFVREAGYNRWAASNRLIVLYPQVVARTASWTFNPRGCWDWWGYTGAAYATKDAPQMRAVLAMVERLGSQPKER